MRFVCLLAATFAAVPYLVSAWGKEGHEIVGNVAWSLLSSTARAATTQILSFNQTGKSSSFECTENCSPLALVADWADQVKYSSAYHWSAPLHFIDVQDQEIPGHCRVNNHTNCHFVYDRDCRDNFCVAGATMNYTHHLKNQESALGKQESLKFLVHFVGDIHQVRSTPVLLPCRNWN